MNSLILSNATIVTPEETIEGSLVCEDGLIVAVEARQIRGGLDLGGAIVAAGFIDLHNDGLEGEINPRPGVGLPLDFALSNFDRRAAASGITLAFHAITFAGIAKKERSVEAADERATAIRRMDPAKSIVEHQVLFRADVWQPEGLPLLFERAMDWDTRLVTLNDHTPGQGQYRDIDIYRAAITKWVELGSEAEASAHVVGKMAFAREHPELANETFAKIAAAVPRLGMTLGSHDDDSAERCAFMHGLGATISEFPVTVEAAQKARELGMTIVAGAPNVVRGGSHSGNVSALELVMLGFCDILVADYHAPSLLLAVQRLVEECGLALAEAMALVTRNPAAAIGRSDLGVVEPGRNATLTIVRTQAGAHWRAVGVVRGGVLRAQFEPLSAVTAGDNSPDHGSEILVGAAAL